MADKKKQPNVMQAAKQTFDGAVGGAKPRPQGTFGTDQSQSIQAPPQAGLPPVPHHIAQQLAQAVSNLHPIALGTLIYHALQQHGQLKGAPGGANIPQGPSDLGGIL